MDLMVLKKISTHGFFILLLLLILCEWKQGFAGCVIVQKFSVGEICNAFESSLLCTLQLHLFDQK